VTYAATPAGKLIATFDGRIIEVRTLRGRMYARIPLGCLISLEMHRNGRRGAAVFTARRKRRNITVGLRFRRQEQPFVRELCDAVWLQHEAGIEAEAAGRARPNFAMKWERRVYRLLTLDRWLTGSQLVLLVVPTILCSVGVIWFAMARR
jgi:hypothetical protein